jgi:hypothetical protein
MASDYMREKYGVPEPTAPPQKFDPIEVTGFISSTAIRFNTLNEMIFEVIVPREYVDEALPLRVMVGKTLVPLKIRVEIHPDHIERVEELESQLEERVSA